MTTLFFIWAFFWSIWGPISFAAWCSFAHEQKKGRNSTASPDGN